MRYKYIFNGGVEPNSNISNYRLLDRQKMQGESDVLRVEIPEDAILEKWDCDEYSTWDMKNDKDYQLKELNPKICIKINGKWSVLEEATNEWLNGKSMSDAIKEDIKDKYFQIPRYNIGFLTFAQYHWYEDNFKYAWRFDRLPEDLSNVKIPPLTASELETLDFVRKEFDKYYEEMVDASYFYDDDEKEEAKEFFKEYIKEISNDDLASRWHHYSTSSLDPCKKFETKEMIEKMERSKYHYVYKDHYKHAIGDLIDNLSTVFYLHQLHKEKETTIEEEDYEI